MSAEELRGELSQIQAEVDQSAELFAGHENTASEAATATEDRITGADGVDAITGQTKNSADLLSTLADVLSGTSRDTGTELGAVTEHSDKVGELATWMARIAERSNNDNATNAAGHIEEAAASSDESQEALTAADKAIEDAAEAAANAAQHLTNALGSLAVLKEKMEAAVAGFTASGEQDGEAKNTLKAASDEIETYMAYI